MKMESESLTLEQLQQHNAQLEQQNTKQAHELAELSAKLKWYEEQFRLAQQKRFGASSEKTNPDQLELNLFNEAEVTAAPEPEKETLTYERRKTSGKREAELAKLPVETVTYVLAEEEQVCACCGGALHEMTTETRREIAVVPAQVKVVEHVRQVYACRHCENHELQTPIVTAPMPRPVYPGSLASPSALAHIMCQKYVGSQPLYRQEQEWTRLGYPLSRQTMANWMIYGAEQWLLLMVAELKRHLLKQGVLHADETTLQVLQEPGKAAQSDSYMWLYRTGRGVAPVVIYEYQRTRGGEHPRDFLAGFKGYLHVDGYAGYHKVKDVTLVGCWAHARRKYDEALKVAPEARSNPHSVAAQGLAWCNQLFTIERELKEATPEERLAARKEQSQAVLDGYYAWLRQQKTRTMPKSLLGQAIGYSLNQWEKLTAFMKDGVLEIDNNRGERAIKPFVIGRKNWLFAYSPRGARASAAIYSVIETAKENGLHPFRYLTYLFEQLPQLVEPQEPQALAAFMPWSSRLPDSCRLS
jgi:transposase